LKIPQIVKSEDRPILIQKGKTYFYCPVCRKHKLHTTTYTTPYFSILTCNFCGNYLLYNYSGKKLVVIKAQKQKIIRKAKINKSIMRKSKSLSLSGLTDVKQLGSERKDILRRTKKF
jgi:ribosomal protein S27E